MDALLLANMRLDSSATEVALLPRILAKKSVVMVSICKHYLAKMETNSMVTVAVSQHAQLRQDLTV